MVVFCAGVTLLFCAVTSAAETVLRRKRCPRRVANLKRLPDFQSIRGTDVVSLCQIAEIVPGDPCNIEQRIAALHGIGAAAGIATFRNVPILTVIHYAAIFSLNRLFHWLYLRRLRNWTLNRLDLRRLLRR